MSDKKTAKSDFLTTNESAKKQKDNKSNKKNKKPNVFRRIGGKFKDIFSEVVSLS